VLHPKGWLTLAVTIILISGVHHVRSEWRQVEIQPGTQAEDRSAETHPRTGGAGSKDKQVSGDRSPRATTVGAGMNTPPPPALPLAASIPNAVKKKRVLLVDTSQAKREMRAEVMRKLGIDVDCAADIAEARLWWRAALYDLVLISMEKGRGHRDRFCDDIRSATPPQRLAFLVGKPEYLADSPHADEELTIHNANDQIVGDIKVALAAGPGDLTQPWGILEASRRISQVRSASIARTHAMRSLPPPPRDSEGRPAKRTPITTNLDDLLKEELR
jgi:CheY-like chemotaxis protein